MCQLADMSRMSLARDGAPSSSLPKSTVATQTFMANIGCWKYPSEAHAGEQNLIPEECITSRIFVLQSLWLSHSILSGGTLQQASASHFQSLCSLCCCCSANSAPSCGHTRPCTSVQNVCFGENIDSLLLLIVKRT